MNETKFISNSPEYMWIYALYFILLGHFREVPLKIEAEIVESIPWLVYGLEDRVIEVRFPGWGADFISFKTSTSALGPTRPPIQLLPTALLPGVKWPDVNWPLSH
jgi:hypothetical protein